MVRSSATGVAEGRGGVDGFKGKVPDSAVVDET
jgi:hypothetical protein